MKSNVRNLVLVHGLWDTPRIFQKLLESIDTDLVSVFTPYLPHDGGKISIAHLARDLETQICYRFGCQQKIDLLGFSMGGLICRFWLQRLGGACRTNNFISVGCPHRGTFTAQLAPACLFAGISEMKRGSLLLNDLNNNYSSLNQVKCSSFFCRWDLMVIPGWQAALPLGTKVSLPALTHKGLITNSQSLSILANSILST